MASKHTCVARSSSLVSSPPPKNHPRLHRRGRVSSLSLDDEFLDLDSGRNVNDLFNELEKVEDKVKDMKETGTVHKTCGVRVSILKAKAETKMKAIITTHDSLESLEKRAENLERMTFEKVKVKRSASFQVKVRNAFEDLGTPEKLPFTPETIRKVPFKLSERLKSVLSQKES